MDALTLPPGLASHSAKRNNRRVRGAAFKATSTLAARVLRLERALQIDAEHAAICDVSTASSWPPPSETSCPEERLRAESASGPDVFDIFSDDGDVGGSYTCTNTQICLGSVGFLGLGLPAMSSRAYWRTSCSAEIREEAALVVQEWWRRLERKSAEGAIFLSYSIRFGWGADRAFH